MSTIGAVSAVRPTTPPVVQAPAPPARVQTLGPAIVDDISAAGRQAAQSRARLEASLGKLDGGFAGPDLDLNAPPTITNLAPPPPTPRLAPGPGMSVNQINQAAFAGRQEPGLLGQLYRGEIPLGAWSEGPVHAQAARRPGKAIEDAGAASRSEPGLSARIARGEGMVTPEAVQDVNTQAMRRVTSGPTEQNARR